MKHNRFHFIVDLKIYACDIIVSIGETDKQLFKVLDEYEGITEADKQLSCYNKHGAARYCSFENGLNVIRLQNTPKTPDERGNLAHEVFHIVAAVLWRAGVKLEIEVSNEAYAYLTGFLTTQIYERIQK